MAILDVGKLWRFARSIEEWPFLEAGAIRTVPACGDVQVGDGETARRLVLAGVGLARLSRFHIDPDIRDGRLVPVLEDLNPGDVEEIHAVFDRGAELGQSVDDAVESALDFARNWAVRPDAEVPPVAQRRDRGAEEGAASMRVSRSELMCTGVRLRRRSPPGTRSRARPTPRRRPRRRSHRTRRSPRGS